MAVTFTPVDTRDLYIKEIKAGNVQIAPDYLSSLTDRLNRDANGDAPSVATNDVDATLARLQELADKDGLAVLDPSDATDQNAFFVAKDFADENSLTTLSDLGALDEPITRAAAEDCADRSDGAIGLEKTYGLDIRQVLPLGFGTQQTKKSVLDGESHLDQAGTTDGSLDAQGLALLEDDKACSTPRT